MLLLFSRVVDTKSSFMRDVKTRKRFRHHERSRRKNLKTAIKQRGLNPREGQSTRLKLSGSDGRKGNEDNRGRALALRQYMSPCRSRRKCLVFYKKQPSPLLSGVSHCTICLLSGKSWGCSLVLAWKHHRGSDFRNLKALSVIQL